jgi:hypothetical protein
MLRRRYSELVPGYELPEFRLTIRNTSGRGIHDDATASSYGYRGGLVPGNTVYAHLSQGLVGYFGSAWLASGHMQVRFARPLYEREETTCKYVVTEREEDSGVERVHFDITAENSEGIPCARGLGSFLLVESPPPPAELPFVSAARRGDLVQIPPVTPGNVALNMPFEPQTIQDSTAASAAYVELVGDPLPIYERFVHPGCLLGWGARADSEVRGRSDTESWGPAVHVAYNVQNFRPALAGRQYTVYGAFIEDYNRNGSDYYTTDALICDGDEPVARVQVTTIYRLKPRP